MTTKKMSGIQDDNKRRMSGIRDDNKKNERIQNDN
jgi:hypothetical protein